MAPPSAVAYLKSGELLNSEQTEAAVPSRVRLTGDEKKYKHTLFFNLL